MRKQPPDQSKWEEFIGPGIGNSFKEAGRRIGWTALAWTFAALCALAGGLIAACFR